jgi:hypothetical protein
MIGDYCRIAFGAVDLVVVVSQNRRALPASQRARLRRQDHRTMDQWRAVISAVRPDLRPTDVATLAVGVLPMINIYPQFLHDLPSPGAVEPLVRAYLTPGSQ